MTGKGQNVASKQRDKIQTKMQHSRTGLMLRSKRNPVAISCQILCCSNKSASNPSQLQIIDPKKHSYQNESSAEKWDKHRKQLLKDIIEIFNRRSLIKIRSKVLLECLTEDTNKVWATFRKGNKPLTSFSMNALLEEHGIHSRDIRFKHGVFKGFMRTSFSKMIPD